MRKCFDVWLCTVAGTFFAALLGVDVYAMSAFSGKYNMECKACHTKVPELNKFGLAFMKNDFKIPGKESTPKDEKPQISSKGLNDPTQDASEGKAHALTGTGSDSSSEKTPVADGDKKKQTALPADAEQQAPVEIYRWVKKDGSMFFTDNPLRKPADTEERKQRVVRTRVARQAAGKTSVRLARGPRQALKKESRKMNVASAEKPKVSYRTFPECMEKVLLQRPAPENAQVAMEIFVETERACVQFKSGER